MEDADGGLWRTLARIYAVVLACGVFVPGLAAVPVLLGFGSLFVTLLFGGIGLGIAGGVVLLVDAWVDDRAASARPDSTGSSDPPIEPPTDPTRGE
ncbi:hypothetical protein [Salinigranum sp. GCM10025319]|uniref:hypothetical protein n=1 Tax=Salinigranum sp. GCM10025319 TaxID=3252687 RepID=UPI0036233AAE